MRRQYSLPSRLSFESLEAREMLSAISANLLSADPALARARRDAFVASGTASLIGMPPSENNSGFRAGTIGWATHLGKFSGTMNVATSQNGGANVELSIHGRHRSGLRIVMTVLGSNNSGPTTDFDGTFSIARGFGRLRRTVGGGSVNGVVYGQAQDLTFDLVGKSVH